MRIISDFLKGICIGAGAILPGISSGVLCVIFGIYDKLVESILGIFHNFKKNFFYLLPIFLGSTVGIILLGNILSLLLNSFPSPTKYAFIGLILGSIPMLIKQINSQNKFKLHYIFYTIIAFELGLLAVILEKYLSSSVFTANSYLIEDLYSNTIPSFFPIVLLAIAGFFMSIGIVVPGVSSTLILMCFGVYNIYLESVSTINLPILIPIGFGVVLGGFIFLKIIKFLLSKYYMQTFYSIIGFTLGSVLVLYVPITFDFSGIISIVLFLLCFYIAQLFEKKGN